MSTEIKGTGVPGVHVEKDGESMFVNEGVINERAADFRSFYANNTAFAMSPFDFNLIFGEIVGAKDRKMVVEQKVKVIMSPLHAKIFVQVMVENLKQFEATFGEIKLPEGAVTVTNQG
jgi:hypothetical protein